MQTAAQDIPQLKASKKISPSAQDDVRYLRFHCASLTPLFMDPMPPDVVFDTLVKGKRPPPDKTTPLKERCEKKLYLGPNGEIGLPSDVLFACLEAASSTIKVGKKKLGTAKGSELGSMLEILEPFIVFPEDCQAWVPDCRRGVGKTGIANGITRPRFDTWHFSFTVKVNVGQVEGLSIQHIVDLVDSAGRQKGIGAFRKRYGRFHVTEGEIMEPVKGNGSGS